MVYMKTDDIYKDIAEDVERSFDISNYELQKKNEKVIASMKDKLNGKILKVFSGLRVKTYSYLINDGTEDKKPKSTTVP